MCVIVFPWDAHRVIISDIIIYMHHSPITIIDSLILRSHMECTATAFNVYTYMCIYV